MRRRRPLVTVCLFLIAGILLGRYLLSTPLILIGVTTFLLILSAALHLLKFNIGRILILLTILFLGALLYSSSRLPAERLHAKIEYMESARGIVVNYPTNGVERSSFVIKPEGQRGYLQVFYYHKHDLNPLRIDYGDEVRLRGKFEVPWEFEEFNYREYLLQRDIWGVVSIWAKGQIEKLASGRGKLILHLGYRIREYLFQIIDRNLSVPENNLLKAILFGERGYLGKDIEEDFRDAGVMHVLAVSGLHLGIIVGVFWWILSRFYLSATKIYLIMLPVVFLYLLIVGFRVSLVRAAVLFGFLTLGLVARDLRLILRKWADPYQGLSAAALVILVFNPQALFGVSFQLSFAATAAIIFFLPSLEKVLRRLSKPQASSKIISRLSSSLKRFVITLLGVSMAAQLGVIPFIAYHFHRVYLLVTLANLVVIPLITLALWGGVGVIMIGILHIPLLSSIVGTLEGWLLKGLSCVTDLLAMAPFSYLEFERGFLIVMAAYSALLLGLIVALRLKWEKVRSDIF